MGEERSRRRAPAERVLPEFSASTHGRLSAHLSEATLDRTETSALVVMATCYFSGVLTLGLSSAEAGTSQPKE